MLLSEFPAAEGYAMSNEAVVAPAVTEMVHPVIHKIEWRDLVDALSRGFADFSARPSHMVFLCLIYPIVGVMIGRATMQGDLLPLFFPLSAGFALIGPFAAIGLYELSRRREQGMDASWSKVFDVIHLPSIGAILGIGVLLMVIFVAWLAAAEWIYKLTLGPAFPTSIAGFAHDLFGTSAGWALIIVGNVAGFFFAGVALTIGVVSFPMLVDRNVGFAAAISTSVRCIAANPMTLALWGFIVAAVLFVGAIPVFVGLAVALPVLGHATWHLYRKLVSV